MTANTWKLQDAKARFSELVRKARKGEPQTVTVHGEPAVIVTALKKSRAAKSNENLTMAGFAEESKKYRGLELKIPPRTRSGVSEIMTTAEFIERSKKYRGLGLKIPPRTKMKLRWDPAFGNDES
jgi:prevent-host-death family protein